MDDRAGCAAILELAGMLKERHGLPTLYLVFSVQEEFNLRGAQPAAQAEVRAITNRPESFDSVVMMSSVSPSAKISCSPSVLILSKGKTTIDGLAGNGCLTCTAR